MERTKVKKAWMTPELTVLVRSRPEEAVLVGCKLVGNSGPQSELGSCEMDFAGCGECYPMLMS